MRYSGILCPVCGREFNDSDDVVVCPVCGTPHHRDCWNAENRCANEEKHEEGFEWKFPEGKDPVERLYKEAQEKKKKENVPDFSFKNGEGVRICDKCGAINYENDAFCMRCHAPLGENGTAPREETASQQGAQGFVPPDPRMGAYENQRLFGGLDPNVQVCGIPAGELSDYIGGKTPGKFIRKYASAERFGSRFTLNFPAMLLGPVYLFYRKLYKAGALIIAALAVLSFSSVMLIMTPSYKQMCADVADITMQLASGQISQSEYQEEFQRINDEYLAEELTGGEKVRAGFSELLRYVSYFTYIGCGLIFDRLYLKKMKQDVEEARIHNDNMQSYRMTLTMKGGISAIGAVTAVLLLLASLLITEIPTLIYMFG